MNNSSEKEKEAFREWTIRMRFKPVDTDPEAVYAAIRNRIRKGDEPVRIRRHVSVAWKYISFAASLGLLVALSVLAFQQEEKEARMAWIEVAAVPGAKTQILLPDSSRVWLNEKARIRYPQAFSDRERRVEFTGEALFEVAKDQRRPFIVRVEGMRVKVLGTVFNIFEDPASDRIETTLLEGQIALFKESNVTGRADLILEPAQQAIFDKRSGKMELQSVKTSLYTAWKDRNFSFEKNTVEEIMKTLERAFHIEIRIESESLKAKRLTARFTHDESLEEILSVLQFPGQYRYAKEKGIVYIREK